MSKIVSEKKSFKNQGWSVTIAGTAALLALGVLYSWSVFKANIPVEWGWMEAQKSLPYSVACVVFSIMTFVGARLLARYSPRLIVSAGGIMAGLGVIISSFSSSPWVFTIAFGIILGSGLGFVYASAGPTAIKWFSASKTGLISGIVVAGFGMGSVWVAPLARSLMASLGLQTTMFYLGIGMLIAVVGFAQLLKNPPDDCSLSLIDLKRPFAVFSPFVPKRGRTGPVTSTLDGVELSASDFCSVGHRRSSRLGTRFQTS